MPGTFLAHWATWSIDQAFTSFVSVNVSDWAGQDKKAYLNNTVLLEWKIEYKTDRT